MDQNWLYGYCLNDPSKRGIFPVTHVSRVYLEDELEAPLSQFEFNKTNNFQVVQIKQPNKSIVEAKASYMNQSHLILRQAVVKNEFLPPYDDQLNSYLKLDVGDYVLVTGVIDENWLIGENIRGDKGLFPLSSIQYLDEKERSEKKLSNNAQMSESLAGGINNFDSSINEFSQLEAELPILNRTQRKYTLTSSSELDAYNMNENLTPQRDNATKVEQIQTSPSLTSSTALNELDINKNSVQLDNEQTNKSAQFCRANYDFQPKNSNELGCLCGDYLQVVDVYKNSEWVKVTNFYGKSGLVPMSFISLLDRVESSRLDDLFKRNKKSSESGTNLDGLVRSELRRYSDASRSAVFQHASSYLNTQNTSRPELWIV
jgi:hypothetical protein